MGIKRFLTHSLSQREIRMERRDLYQDDLTEENLPSPAERDRAQAPQELDPDVDSAQNNLNQTEDTAQGDDRA